MSIILSGGTAYIAYRAFTLSTKWIGQKIDEHKRKKK